MILPLLRRVALLGIAQRQIRIKYAQNSRKQQRSKPLPASIQTIGDWIQVKRMEKNLSPCHLAAKASKHDVSAAMMPGSLLSLSR